MKPKERPQMSADSLRGFLKNVASQGSFESSGRFTVDINKQRMKLRLNQFPNPTHYLLCCVRAGVTSGSSSVQVQLSYSQTRVLLQSPKELGARALLEGVLGKSSVRETERLLGAAFQGGLNAGAEAVRVLFPGGTLVLTKDSMDVLPNDDYAGECCIEFQFPKKYKRNRERCAREYSAVYVRGAFCPIPLFLDGLSVVDSSGWEGLFSWQRSDESYGVDKDFAWLEAFMTSDEENFFGSVSRRRAKVEYIGGERFFSQNWQPNESGTFLRIAPSAKGERPQIGSITRLGSKLEGNGHLFILKQGVILDPVAVNMGGPAVGVVIRGDHLKTDASLFKPVENDDYERLVGRVQAQTKGLVWQLSRERKSFALSHPETTQSFVWKTLAGGLSGAFVGLSLGALGSFLLGGASSFVVATYLIARYNDRVMVEKEQRIRWELDTYVDVVAPNVGDRLRL